MIRWDYKVDSDIDTSLNMCSYDLWMDSEYDTKIISSGGASSTIQILAKIRSGNIPLAIEKLSGKSIFMKISPHMDVLDSEGSNFYECLVYRYLALLRKSNVVLSVPSYYTDFACKWIAVTTL